MDNKDKDGFYLKYFLQDESIENNEIEDDLEEFENEWFYKVNDEKLSQNDLSKTEFRIFYQEFLCFEIHNIDPSSKKRRKL